MATVTTRQFNKAVRAMYSPDEKYSDDEFRKRVATLTIEWLEKAGFPANGWKVAVSQDMIVENQNYAISPEHLLALRDSRAMKISNTTHGYCAGLTIISAKLWGERLAVPVIARNLANAYAKSARRVKRLRERGTIF